MSSRARAAGVLASLVAPVVVPAAMMLGCAKPAPTPPSTTAGALSAPPAAAAPPPAGPIAHLRAGGSHTCFVMRDGRVACAGAYALPSNADPVGLPWSDARPYATVIPGAEGVVDVAPGDDHDCAWRSNGRVLCWGTANRLGAHGAAGHAAVVVPGLEDVAQLASGWAFSCARRHAGTIACWGDNDHYQLGLEEAYASETPVEIEGIRHAVSLAVGASHACARLSLGGAVVCWGKNEHGELGDPPRLVLGSRRGRPRAAPVPELGTVAELALGGDHSCARLAGGRVLCWGGDRVGQLGDGGGHEERATPGYVEGVASAEQIVSMDYTTCARLAGGEVVCWGYNGWGEIGDGSTTDALVPRPVRGLTDAVELAAGRSHACARRRNGETWCWGAAVAEPPGAPRPARVPAPPGPRVTSLAAQAFQLCAVRADGSVVCAGKDVGQGDTPVRADAALLDTARGAVSVAVSVGHACATLRDGTAMCWGGSPAGERGDQSFESGQLPPAAVRGLTQAVAVATTRLSSCALRRGGDVVCWGQPLEDHMAPRGERNYQLTPVAGLGDARSLSAGCFHACAVTAGGAVACWGENDAGQLGDGTTTARAGAVRVTGPMGAVEVSAGCSHTCARTAGGDVWCWGKNLAGELGDETTEDRLRPVAVHALHGATRVAAGDRHTCALAGGAVWCWGADTELLPPAPLAAVPRPPLPLPLSIAVTDLALGPHILVIEDAEGALHCLGDYCVRDEGKRREPRMERVPVARFGPSGEALPGLAR